VNTASASRAATHRSGEQQQHNQQERPHLFPVKENVAASELPQPDPGGPVVDTSAERCAVRVWPAS
jgi:hypothetical protein